ncbi:stalk domain-containing protein [Metasolibacillus meyeri]|uniref:stalk domain-containing protein n=1 Tax=Metasolibacillus meyeri TaxID=1071052 RepID=UPI00187D3065|nr:stalk domain-containing protein [Metasolibacillus meyeri]
MSEVYKRLISCVLILILGMMIENKAMAANGAPAGVIVNGKSVVFTSKTGYPYVDKNGFNMVPFNPIMKATGASVGFDKANNTAIVVTEHDRIEVSVGEKIFYNNNIEIAIGAVAVKKDGKIYVPFKALKAVLESADFTVEWDRKTKTINAYTFKFNKDEYVPYSTSSAKTLVTQVLKGNVVYIKGKYYATPQYLKMLTNTEVIYLGDDLNKAIYPERDRFSSTDFEYVPKDWVSIEDLRKNEVSFKVINYSNGTYVRKGFFSVGSLTGMTSSLYEMPNLADDFITNPIAGVYEGITVKVVKGEIFFKQADLIKYNILKEPITETVIMP